MQIYTSDSLTIYKVGVLGGEAYLVTTPERTLLFDSGFAYAAPALVDEVEALLDGRQLNYHFLSHSHYDHASGSVWVKKRWSQVKVLGSAHAARVFERPGARKTICSLNIEAAKEALAQGRISAELASTVEYALLEKFSVDETVDGSSIIDLGGITLEVLEAPGHTRCSLMLWCPDERLLFGSESLGVMLDKDIVSPACLTGYHDSLDSIAMAQALKPEHILVCHRQVISGEEATCYLINAQLWAERTARFIWVCNEMGMPKSRIAELLKELFYRDDCKDTQPEAAFDLNNGYMIDQILASKETPSQ